MLPVVVKLINKINVYAAKSGWQSYLTVGIGWHGQRNLKAHVMAFM